MPILRTGRDDLAKLKDDQERIDLASDQPNLTLFKQAIEDTQSDASDFYNRNEQAWAWWHSRWPGQTLDGLKWSRADATERVWPWEGSSDTRVGTVAKVIGQHATVIKYATMNMHLQGKSSRPLASGRQSEQATVLANWMLFTHMLEELTLEIPLLANWRNGYGSAILWTDWEQERRIDYIPISLMSLQQFAQQSGGQQGGQQNVLLEYVQSAIADPTQEDDMVKLVQMMSPIVTTAQARSIIKDLRQLRIAQIPVPYVYKSKPRWTALRPMVDILFPAATDDLQRARWIDRVEWLTETELVDRVETAGYDPTFVDEALAKKGTTSHEPWASRTMVERSLFGNFGYYNDALHDFDNKIELHHFYYKCLDRGTPTIYRTIFHMDVEEPAKHGHYGYTHGKYPGDAFRFEKHERPILSSRGIAEVAYTWEKEIKKQRDGRTDMTDLALRPPLFAPYQDVLRIKQSFSPGVIWPLGRGGKVEFMPPTPYNQSSIQIEETVMKMVNEYFGLFGGEVDRYFKKLRQQDVADDFLFELKRPVMQMWQLMQQYLPDDEVAHVVGQLQRPFKVSRAEIQGAYEFTLTVDMRELDNDFIKQKGAMIKELMAWDKGGVINSTPIIRRMFEALDYTLADEALQSDDAASNKEQQDEHDAISKIVGSGLDQPLPPGANHKLRLEYGQQLITQNLQTNPAFQKKMQENPDIQKILLNRLEYHKRQLQQQENAKIGRVQVSQTFNKEAPQLALPKS